MTISLQCPQCHAHHQVADAMAGKQARCRCGAVLTIPMAQPQSVVANVGYVQCPGCGRQHQSNPVLAGATVRCACGAAFQLPGAGDSDGPLPNWLDRESRWQRRSTGDE